MEDILTSDEVIAFQLREQLSGLIDEKKQVLGFKMKEPLNIKDIEGTELYNKHVKWCKDIQIIEDNMAIVRAQLTEVLNRINWKL